MFEDLQKQHEQNVKSMNRRFIRTVLIILAVMVALIGSCTYVITSQVEKAGGVKQIMIDAGEDIKDIKQEIDNHEPES